MLKSHPAPTAIDEPFHPALVNGERSNKKGTWDDLARLLTPVGTIEPKGIAPLEELNGHLSSDQKGYVQRILAAQEIGLIDVVRCWNTTNDILELDGDIVFVHILRDIQGWVQAHLLPTGPASPRKRVADVYRRASFFKRRQFFDNYHYQTIITEALRINHPMWAYCNLTPQQLSREPAYVQLMAFWWCTNLTMFAAYRETERPCHMVSLDTFSRAPRETLDAVTGSANWAPHSFDVGQVRTVRPAYKETSHKWSAAADRIGIPKLLLTAQGRAPKAITQAFASALKDISI